MNHAQKLTLSMTMNGAMTQGGIFPTLAARIKINSRTTISTNNQVITVRPSMMQSPCHFQKRSRKRINQRSNYDRENILDEDRPPATGGLELR